MLEFAIAHPAVTVAVIARAVEQPPMFSQAYALMRYRVERCAKEGAPRVPLEQAAEHVWAVTQGLVLSIIASPAGTPPRPRHPRRNLVLSEARAAMSYQCAHCGETHDELPQYFLCRTPESAKGKALDVERDGKSMCRSGKKCFVACEVEFPFEDSNIEPLGYVCWAEVAPKDYKSLEKFWRTEAPEDDPGPVAGTLANDLTGVPDTFGTRVRFVPLAKDPTPYVRWIDPESPLGRLVEARITHAFWHDLVTAVHAS